jgi:NAD(P)-dependent dehydrogenase (short-subunit alcohol dehydrogenase family)
VGVRVRPDVISSQAPGHVPAAFITGAAGGIGAALARRLVVDGWGITLVDLDGMRLERVAADLERMGGHVQSLNVDVAFPGATEAALQQAIDHWDGIDLVAPFAGIFVGPAMPVTPELRRLLRAVNLHHPMACAEWALLRADERGCGCVAVMPLSDAGLQLRDPWIYARAKAELHVRSGHLARRWRHRPMHVLQAVVYPTRTDFGRNSDAALEAHLITAAADHSLLDAFLAGGAEPDDVAAAIVDAVRRRRRWLYLEPTGGRWRLWACLKGQVAAPVLDRLPVALRRRVGVLPRVERSPVDDIPGSEREQPL